MPRATPNAPILDNAPAGLQPGRPIQASDFAYAVGFGGSMIWFGSSAGVALASQFPQARSVKTWVTSGWHVAVGYVLGYFVLLLVLGWHPDPAR